jgi:hypothetical protein
VWQLAFKFGWATEADLDEAINIGKLTADEKTQILAG